MTGLGAGPHTRGARAAGGRAAARQYPGPRADAAGAADGRPAAAHAAGRLEPGGHPPPRPWELPGALGALLRPCPAGWRPTRSTAMDRLALETSPAWFVLRQANQPVRSSTWLFDDPKMFAHDGLPHEQGVGKPCSTSHGFGWVRDLTLPSSDGQVLRSSMQRWIAAFKVHMGQVLHAQAQMAESLAESQ